MSASWAVPADAVSGIYFAKLVREDRHRRREPHRLRRARRRRRTPTCCSRPRTRPGRPTTSTAATASTPAARPTGPRLQGELQPPVHDARRRRAEDWLFNAEYPMVRWLEPTATTSATPRASTPTGAARELLEHKVVPVGRPRRVLVGRPARQRRGGARRGVHLAFFSGNEVFWKTRWENSIDGIGHAVPHAGLLQGDARQRQDRSAAAVWTGTWRDPRFSPPADGGRPENALTGTHLHGQLLAATAIQVPGRRRQDALLAQHRASRRSTAGADRHACRRTRSATSGTRTSTTASRPPGLIRLSSTTVERRRAPPGLRLDLRARAPRRTR